MTTAVGHVRSALADPRSDPAWARLARGPRAHLFLAPPWLRAVTGTYGFEARCRMLLGADGEARAGLAWVPVSDMLGERVISLPFSDHGTPIVDDGDTWDLLVEGLAGAVAPYTVRCFEEALSGGVPAGLDPRGTAAWHGTRVDPDRDAMFARLSRHARRNVRIAQRAGVTVRASTGLDAVRAFHTLHRRLRRDKYGLLAQPWAFFERIWAEFTASGGIVTALAEVDGRPVAGAVFLQWGDVLYYKFGASLREHLDVRPNDAVFWAGLTCAADRGATLLDWGLSDLDQPGLIDYKRKWASQERTLMTLRGGGDAAPDVSEQRALLTRLTGLLTGPEVPDAVTSRGGELLYRYFC